MKLSRVRTADGIKPAAVDQNGDFRDLSNHIADVTTAQISDTAIETLARIDLGSCPVITGAPAPFLSCAPRILHRTELP